MPKIHEQLSQAELLLDKHLVDAGYIDASNLVESHQFEEEIGVASSENGLFIANMEFSVRTGTINLIPRISRCASCSSAALLDF